MEGKSFNAGRSAVGPLSCCQLRKERSRAPLDYLHTVSPARGTNEMYFYTTRLLVFLAVTGGLAAAIVLSLSGELIARLFG
jgi:hypothetical protein